MTRQKLTQGLCISLIAIALLAWDLKNYPRAIVNLYDTISERDGWGVTYAYLGVALTAYFVMAFLISRRSFGWALFLLILASHLTSRAFQVLTFEQFSVYDFEILLRAQANKYQAMRFYAHNLREPIIQSVVVYLGIFLFAFFSPAKFPSKKRDTIIASIMLVSFSFFFASLDHMQAKALPSAFQVPNSAIEYYRLPLYTGERAALAALPNPTKYPLHIVMIMDESVRGDYLHVNGYPLGTTPFIENLGKNYVNLGNAVSMTNLTYTSNYAVFTGLRQDQLPDRDQLSRKNPTLFQYAQAAGRSVRILFSAMHLSDYQDWSESFAQGGFNVDMVVSYPGAEVDRHFISALDSITSSDKPSFTWINKWGCHLPYVENSPPGIYEAWWEYSGARKLSPTETHYINCVKWQLDAFFEQLFEVLKGREVLILYTSDHGESLDLSYATTSHGQLNNPPSEQAITPLMLFALNDKTADTIQSMFRAENVDKLQGSQLFPTLLGLFGYDESVLMKYDPPITKRLNLSRQTFLSGNLWGFGRSYINEFGETKTSR